MKRKNYLKMLLVMLALTLLVESGWSQQRRVGAVNRSWNVKAQQQEMTAENEQEVLDYVKEHFPEQLARLQRLEISRPEAYMNAVRKYYSGLKMLENVKERNPERYKQLLRERELEEESRILARNYKEADSDSRKDEIKGKLEKLLFESFDYRQINRQKEIERLETRLEQLKKDNKARLRNKDEIVQRQLQKLTGEKSALEW